tara:strand:- start:3093 stop:3380 length:288 start_codon:yes stop_codon:yes gene_type:complete
MAGESYDPQGLFVDVFTQTEIESLLTEAKKVFTDADGAQTVTWSSTGMSVTKRFNLDALQIIKECMYALRLIAPATYPNYPYHADQATVKVVSDD